MQSKDTWEDDTPDSLLTTSGRPTGSRQTFYSRRAHRRTSSFLQLGHFSGEGTDQIVSSIAVVIRAIHLQEEEEEEEETSGLPFFSCRGLVKVLLETI
ncbi:hypothetical protein EYF80_049211 [Liparis tanakae]|uniref:Uncharacterized protein n=1 Tax=Liparis tanakae TaxID=230148 RepID=A0A4Z2FI54_9TELE|nr:hypothetical protein EYF80_049211 [Liparis tanakae]